MKKISLSNGKELQITLAPFKEARELYQAILKSCKGIKIDVKTELDVNFFKDISFELLSSKEVEEALEACMRRCLIDKLKIDENTFEPEEMREVYLQVCFEVAKANVLPFMKSLYAEFGPILAEMKKGLA